jgi:glycosyltransferase involved in cell wall biosynthesis
MVSIIIPFINEFSEIESVLMNLLTSCDINDTEIIVVNDGSREHSGKFHPLELSYPNVKVINTPAQRGVGFSFDRWVELASGDIIILTASDVFPEIGWYEKVVDYVNQRPESIGCAVCVGSESGRKHYGADLLFTVGIDDLPPKSKLRQRRGGYTELFKGRWASKKSDEPYEISCLMGAFYFCKKEWYQKIHGFDTTVSNPWQGHRMWGSLEPYLSLKSWLYGGGCYLTPDIEAKHIFGRADKEHRWDKGKRSAEDRWWNALFILETMILDEKLRRKLSLFPNMELNLGVARQRIRENYKTIVDIRERNRAEFKYDHTIFTDKFGYKFDV